MKGTITGGLLLLVNVATACTATVREPTAVDEPIEETARTYDYGNEVVDGVFRVRLGVDSTEVRPHHAFHARIFVLNTSADSVTWWSPWGCIAFLSVYRGPDKVPFEGSTYGCTASFRRWPIGPADSLVFDHELRAQTDAGLPVPPGHYRLVAEMGQLRPGDTFIDPVVGFTVR